MAYADDVNHTVETAVSTLNDPPFIPGNQAQGDNPDSGTKAQRTTACTATSPVETDKVYT